MLVINLNVTLLINLKNLQEKFMVNPIEKNWIKIKNYSRRTKN